jgi:hypothetical protein
MLRNFKLLAVAVVAMMALDVIATAAASAKALIAGLADLPESQAQGDTAVNP